MILEKEYIAVGGQTITMSTSGGEGAEGLTAPRLACHPLEAILWSSR